MISDSILKAFKQYQYWQLRDLKRELGQPETYVKEILSRFATMWRNGDHVNTWELKSEWKDRDPEYSNANSVAPAKGEAASDTEPSGMDEGDDNEEFEDVKQE